MVTRKKILEAIGKETSYTQKNYGSNQVFFKEKKVALIVSPKLAIVCLRTDNSEGAAIVAFDDNGIFTEKIDISSRRRLVVIPALYEKESDGSEVYPMIYKILDFKFATKVGCYNEIDVCDCDGKKYKIGFRYTQNQLASYDNPGEVEGGYSFLFVGSVGKYGGEIRF